MKPFDYHKLRDIKDQTETGSFLAGGTTLIDLMKLDVETPSLVYDINGLKTAYGVSLTSIDSISGGGLRVGALVRNADLANDAKVQKEFPVLAQALLSGASPQLRNKATTGGNLLQRTRCMYFRDSTKACNKRNPGSGCAAISGIHRNLAILGTSDSCIANNPSDMNVALVALEAKIELYRDGKKRDLEIDDFYLLPKNTPHLEHDLHPREFIASVTIPPVPAGARSLYLKLRDRASYEFALASAAVIAKTENGRFTHLKIAMGGIGSKPWRMREVEKLLLGQPVNPTTFKLAGDEALKNAKPHPGNAFKVELAKKCLAYVLKQVSLGGVS